MSEKTPPLTGLPALRGLVTAFWILTTAESAGAIFYLSSIPADARNALALGFSASRLFIMGIVAAVLVFSLVSILRKRPVLIKALNAPIESQRKWFALLLLLSVGLWQISFLPQYQLGRLLAYYERLQPLLVWMMTLMIQTALLFNAARVIQERSDHKEIGLKGMVIPFALILGGFLVFWLVVLTTGAGIGPGNNYWNKVGVPILGAQIIAAAMLGLVYLYLEEHGRAGKWIEQNSRAVDVLLFLLIWGVTALSVNATPIAPSRFNALPAAPNYAPYPFSDAGEYDLSALGILQGKSITYNYVDKPFHLVFLVAVHLLGGTDFNRVILFQVILLSVMPALLYLLGKDLFNRFAGLIAAVMAVFYQINAIQATNLIQVSNFKMMMSEPLTGIGMIILCLFAVRWLKRPHNWWWNLALVGGAAGLVSLVRLNAAASLVVVFLAAAVQVGWKWKRTAGAATLALLFFALAFAPWSVRNAVVEDNPIQYLKNKVQGVVWNSRLSPIIESSTDDAQPAGQDPAGGAPDLPAPRDGGHDSTAVIWPVVSNYAHNLVSTFLMIPPLLEQGDLAHTIRAPYWDNEWDGRFTRGGVFLLILNLAVTALGAAGAWRRRRMAGLFPLLALPAYHLSSAAALVSGGRYIVPVDWVVYFYYALGLAELAWFGLEIFRASLHTPETSVMFDPPVFRFQARSVLPVAACLLLVGALPWLAESAFPETYPERPPENILQSFLSTADWGQSGINEADVRSFLTRPEAVLVEGRAFYPRFFEPGRGDTGGSASPFGVKNYPHFGFTLLGSERSDVNIYLEEPPAAFKDSSGAMALGCRADEVVEAFLVIDLSNGKTYVRPDLRELKCPLAGPG